MITKNLGFLLLAKYNGIPIASAIFFTYKESIFPKFNGSNERFLNFQPNNLAPGLKNRFKSIEMKLPDRAARIAITQKLWVDCAGQESPQPNFEQFADETDKFSGDDIRAVIERAVELAGEHEIGVSLKVTSKRVPIGKTSSSPSSNSTSTAKTKLVGSPESHLLKALGQIKLERGISDSNTDYYT